MKKRPKDGRASRGKGASEEGGDPRVFSPRARKVDRPHRRRMAAEKRGPKGASAATLVPKLIS